MSKTIEQPIPQGKYLPAVRNGESMRRITPLSVLILLIFLMHCGKNSQSIDATSSIQLNVDDSAVPDSFKTFFWEESNRIALRRFVETNSKFADEILIPPDTANIYYFALVNIYLEYDLPARDSVMEMYTFNPYPDYCLHDIIITLYGTESWTDNWLNYSTTTHIDKIDNLFSKYNMYISRLSDWRDSIGYLYFLFSTDQIINTLALTNKLKLSNKFKSVGAGSANGTLGFPDRILGTLSDNSIIIEFVKGGCTSTHRWIFKVSFDGNVEYLDR
jgi:hypothetical protein